MQLRTYIEALSQYQDNLSIKDRIEIGRPKLFDFEYPIFDEQYRKTFETHFIRNFYMREIGFETEALFKFQLENWLNLHMPYFNKLFESELLKFDPLINSEMTNESTRNTDKDGNINTESNNDSTSVTSQNVNGTKADDSFSRHLESDTPDNRLAITTQDGSGIIQYASSIDESKNKSNSNTTNKLDGKTTDNSVNNANTKTDITETENYIQTRTGKIGAVSYSKLLMEYRDSLIRVEKQIFDEMQQLFMLVY